MSAGRVVTAICAVVVMAELGLTPVAAPAQLLRDGPPGGRGTALPPPDLVRPPDYRQPPPRDPAPEIAPAAPQAPQPRRAAPATGPRPPG